MISHCRYYKLESSSIFFLVEFPILRLQNVLVLVLILICKREGGDCKEKLLIFCIFKWETNERTSLWEIIMFLEEIRKVIEHLK